MILKVYKKNKNNQSFVYLNNSIIEKYGIRDNLLLELKYKNIIFLANLIIQRNLNKDGSIYRRGVINLPKKIVDYYGIENGQKINIGIENVRVK